MGETEPAPALASYRDRITELIEAGDLSLWSGTPPTTAPARSRTQSPRWLLAPSMARSSRAAARRARRSGRPRLTGRGIATQAQRRTWRDAGEAAPNERSWRPQLEVIRGAAGSDRPRPLEFDADGFPIPQPMTSFERRVARLRADEQAK